MTLSTNPRIAIIGLGYVGLPLAVEFGKKYPVNGFEIKQGRTDELKTGRDNTREVEAAELAEATLLGFAADPERINPGDTPPAHHQESQLRDRQTRRQPLPQHHHCRHTFF